MTKTARLLSDLELSWAMVVRPPLETPRLSRDPFVLWHPDDSPELTIPDWGRPRNPEPRVTAWL